MIREVNLAVQKRNIKLQLAKPNKSVIGNLKEAYDRKLTVKLGQVSELSFSLPLDVLRNHENVENENTSKIRERYLVKATLGPSIEWFIITKITKSIDDQREVFNVSCKSLGYELYFKRIKDYKVDAYTINSVLIDILGSTNWTIGIIDAVFNSKYRSFDISSTTKLDAVLQVAETFGGIAFFNSGTRTIDIFHPDNIGQNKGLRFRYEQYLRSLDFEYNFDKFCTRLKIYGKDTSIHSVNPIGQSYIESYDYFLHPFERDGSRNVIQSSFYMSDSLSHAVLDYQNKVTTRSTDFSTYLSQKSSYQTTLTTKQNELATLQTQYKQILDSIAATQESGGSTTTLSSQKTAKETEITTKNSEIASTKSSINSVDASISNLRTDLSYNVNFTLDQLIELQNFIVEQEITENNIDNENELYIYGKGKFTEINTPPIDIKVSIVNFLDCIYEYRNFDKLVIGDQVTVLHNKLKVNVQAKIEEIQFNFDSTDITVNITSAKKVIDAEKRVLDNISKSINTTSDLTQKSINWNTVAYNFDSRNDRINTVPSNPIITNDGTAIDHTLNADGSTDISFEWSFNPTNSTDNQYNIDGFVVYVRSLSTNEQYTFGSTIAQELIFTVPAEKRSLILKSVTANKYYTFGVQSYRHVDADINKSGILKSSIVKSTHVLENPYQPSVNIAFNGNITGTINGVSAITVVNNAANGNSAWGKFSGVSNTLPSGNVEFNFANSASKGGNATNTDAVGSQSSSAVQNATVNFNGRNDRKSTIPADPTILVDGTAVDHVISTDGSCDISFEWGFSGAGDAYDIDGFIVYIYQSTSSLSYNFGTTVANEQVCYVTPEKRAFILYGVPADKYYTIGVQAYRIVDSDINASGVLKSTNIVKSTLATENPYQPSSSISFGGNITGTVNNVAVATLTTNAANGNSAWNKFSGVGSTLPSGNVEFNFAGSSTKGGNATNTDNVGTQTALAIQNTAINFNGRNDRNSTAPANPTIATDGSSVDHTINTDGSSDISFEWLFNGTGNAYDIDGFVVYTYQNITNAAYTFGTDPSNEQVYFVTSDKRAFLLYGVPANKYYTFGIQAYRSVDNDVSVSGVLKSSIIKPSISAENPYQPSSTIAFGGNIIGTVNGVTASTLTTQASNGDTAKTTLDASKPTWDATSTNFNNRNDRKSTTPTTPTIASDGTAVDHSINTDGSSDISFEWGFTGTGDSYDVDGFIVYVYQSASSSAYTFGTDAQNEQAFIVNYDKRAFVLYGVAANKYYTFGIQSFRNVDQDINASGLLKSTITKSTATGENPYQPSSTVAFAGNITGTVNGQTASTITTAVTNFNSRNDRKNTVPANPTVLIDGTAIDHTANIDGSVNMSFEWSFTGTGDAYDIDGFILYIYQSQTDTESTTYTFGTTPSAEQVFYVTPDKLAFIQYGVPANKYYTFGVQAYRIVDSDVNSSGVLKSSIIKSTLAAENPYRPSSTVAFSGDVTGTVNGQSITVTEVDAWNGSIQRLNDIASDGKLTAIEKQAVKKEMDMYGLEKPTIEAQATTYGITTEKTNYTTSYNTLNTYITPFLTDLTATSDIVGTDFRDKFKDYVDKKTILLKAISDKAKQLANGAKTSADSALAQLTELASDNKLTPVEKQIVNNQWSSIVAEKPTIVLQADTYKITTEKTAYTNAYDALNAYITPLITDLTVTSDIDGAVFRTKFKDYNDKKTLLQKAVTDNSYDWLTTPNVNLIQNGGAEISTGRFGNGMPDSWYTFGGSLTSKTRRVSDPSWTMFGNASFEVNAGGAGTSSGNAREGYYQDVYGIASNTAYTVSAYMGAHRCNVQLYVDMMNGDTFVGNTVVAINDNSGKNLLKNTFTTTSTTNKLRIYLIKEATNAGNVNSYLFADNVKLEIGTKATPYVESGNADSINNGTKSSSTIIVADASTSNNTLRADYVVPAGAINAQDTINAAINALPSSGGKVVLLEGTYYINSSINLKSNMTLEGQGQSTTIARDGVATSLSNLISLVSCSYTSVKSLMITGSNTDCSVDSRGLYLDNCDNINIENVRVVNVRSTGGFGYGIYLYNSNYIKVNNCSSLWHTHHGIYTRNISDSVIQNTTSNGNGYYGILLSSYGSTLINVSIINNIVKSNSKIGIYADGDTNRICYNVSITGNECSNNGQEGLYLYGLSHATISNNTCDSNGKTGMYLAIIKSSSITSNIAKKSSYEGIFLYSSDNNTVSSNTLSANGSASYDQFSVNSSSYNNIQSNTIRGDGASPRYGLSINYSGCVGNLITGNDLYGASVSGNFYDTGSGTITSTANRT